MEATTAAGIQDQFLTLLTTQLRHQDPLEPTKQEDFIAQLAQFSTLEGIEKLNANFTDFMKVQADMQSGSSHLFQQMAGAAGLVGTEVTYSQVDQETGFVSQETGIVDAIVLKEGAVQLRIENEAQLIRPNQLEEIGAGVTTPIDAIRQSISPKFF